MRVFVSYRRQDSSGWTGRLVDALQERFGAANVFHDVVSIEPAEHWFDAIRAALDKADCTLVVIGPAWAGSTDVDGKRRLDDPEDLVRFEVDAALRKGKPVIPVVVGGAKMPTDALLPADLKSLAQRQAFELTDHRWRDDVQRLLEAVSGKVMWRKALLVGAGLPQLAFIALWIYAGSLEGTMRAREVQSAAVREAYIDKMKVGTDECMAGVWPEGAVRGKSYRENNFSVTELCSRVSGSLNYFQRFFNDEQLWRSSPSSETAEKFSNIYEKTFNKDFEPYLVSGWTSPPTEAALTLARRAKAEIADQAHQVVELKETAALAAERLQRLENVLLLGKYWTLAMVAAVIVWLARGRKRFFL